MNMFANLFLLASMALMSNSYSPHFKVEEVEPGIITLKGKVISPGPVKIVFSYQDVVSGGMTQHIYQVTDTFSRQIPKYHKQDVSLQVNDTTFHLLVEPNEVIGIEIDKNRRESPVHFTGEDAEQFSDFHELFEAITHFTKVNDESSQKLKKQDPLSYKNYLQSLEQQYRSFLLEYGVANKVDKEIQKWFSTWITYRIANKLCTPFNLGGEKYSVPDTYWDFFSEYSLDDSSSINCTAYFQYLRSYSMYLYNVTEPFRVMREISMEDWGHFYATQINLINEKDFGFGQEVLSGILLFGLLINDFSAFEERKKDLLLYVQSPLLRNKLLDRYEKQKAFRSLATGNNYDLHDYRNESSKTSLIDIVREEHKDKVIYIDVWATWCGPCIDEMPHSVDLQEEFIGEDLVFVYFCKPDNVNNDRAAFILAENNLSGEHYFLNFYQAVELEKFLESSSLPRYLVIDKNGQVVDKDAPRPSSQEIRQLLDEQLHKGK